MNIVTAEKTLNVDNPANVLGRETIINHCCDEGWYNRSK
jgi:hypothetical protein